MEISSVDLSKSENSVAGYLQKKYEEIKKMSREQMIEFLENMKNEGVKVSDQYLASLIENAKKKKDKIALLMYITNVILAGADLGRSKETTVDAMLKSAIVLKNDELLIKAIVISEFLKH